jgi:adenylate kinase family enzyme
MQLIEIFAREIKPIKLAHISDMSDTVVLAGPNGVGKTRLVSGLLRHVQNLQVDPNFYIRVRATCETEQTEWKKSELDTRNPSDAALLKVTVQKRHKRSNLRSSFLNFQSNRTIQQVKAYNWDWNFGDPYLEEVNWNFGFGDMTSRFQDMLHSIFRKIRSRREAIALHYEELVKQRQDALSGQPGSPEEQARQRAEHIAIDPAKFPDALTPFDPLSTESQAAIAKYQLGETEIIENCDQTAMIMDLSQLKIPDRCCFDTAFLDAGRIVNMHISAFIGTASAMNCNIPMQFSFRYMTRSNAA